MFLRQSQEDRTKKNEDLIRELDITLSKLDKDIQHSFKELGITPQELDSFIINRENFSDEEWEEITRVKNELNMQLSYGKNSLSSVKSVKEARAGLPKDGRWIHVR